MSANFFLSTGPSRRIGQADLSKRISGPLLVPSDPPGCPHPAPRPSTAMPDLSPASSTGWRAFTLTPPDPHAIVHDDTRPPETRRLSLCKGKAEREPDVTGGLVSSTRGNASSPARSAARMRPRAANGQQLLLLGLLARDPCVLPSHVRKLTVRRPAHSLDPSRPACRRLGFRAGTSPSTPGALGPHRGVRSAAAVPGADLPEAIWSRIGPTRETTDPIRSFFFLRGVPHDRRARASQAAGLGTRPPAPPPPALRVPAGRPGPARARPPGDSRLDRRCRGSPGRLGVPGAPGSGGQRHRGPGPRHWHHAGRWQSPRGLEVDRSRPPPPGRSGKISPSNDHLVKGRAMPPLEPIWVVVVTVVLVGCVLLAVCAFRRRRR
jgi:hypothetical protein